jgi:biopolymer transport protein ExbB/TolQ
MARRQGQGRDQREPGRLPDPAHRPDHGHHDRPRERKVEEGLGSLAIVATASPFIGLFGTVWGIMHAFQSIAISKNTSLAVVAPSIAEALFATAIGLIAAIPAYIAYNKFSTDAGKYAGRLEGFADDLSTAIQRRLARTGLAHGHVANDAFATGGRRGRRRGRRGGAPCPRSTSPRWST